MRQIKSIFITIIMLCLLILAIGCSARKYDIKEIEEVKKVPEVTVVPAAPNYITEPTQIVIPTLPISPSPVVTAPPVKDPNVIGSYSTRILDRNKNRVNNIKIAVKEINGKRINPNEVFSFNTVVGRRTEEDGYKKARIIIKGKPALGTGGGVCQVSSTLYNAVRKSNMEIVERHHHTKEVAYVPHSKDATVVYGSKDFKFRNTKSYPVMIEAKVIKNRVSISIKKI